MDSHREKQDSFGTIVLKVLLIVIIGGAIFGVGVCAGIRAAIWRGVAHMSPVSTPVLKNKMPTSMGMISKWGGDQQQSRVFGSIVKIETNQITVLDNAAKNQIVLSLSNTIITSSSTEVGLSALKPGQNIAVFGALNENNLFEARLIQVQ